jgi:V8-like Glu-specific endopeptidase
MYKNVFLFAFALSCLACGEIQSDSQLNVIIGENDLSYYLENDRLSKSIGHIELGCTATHIGNGLVLTAGHCIADSSCQDKSYDIVWNFRENQPEGELKSQCLEIIASENNFSADYAILRYDVYPEQSLKVDTSGELRFGDPLTIFSHPNNRALSWSNWCQYLGTLDDSLYRLSYECDTESGSSGAVILNENFDIVGVHNLGIWSRKINGGTFVSEIPELKGKS